MTATTHATLSGMEETDLETPTWSLIRSMGLGSSWSPEFELARHWGFDVVERWLGPDWPANCYHRGGMPPELLEAAAGPRGLAMLIDFAGGLELLGQQSGAGKVRRALRRNPNAETLAATRCVLRFATAGLRSGLTPVPEHGQPPIDLLLANDGLRLTAEIKTLRRPAPTVAMDASLQELSSRLIPHFGEYDVVIEGDVREPLTEHETRDAAQQIVDGMRVAALGVSVPDLVIGQNRFGIRTTNVAEGEKRGMKTAFPPVDLWRRTAGRIRDAAAQSKESGASWLIIESLDHFWQLTPWSQQPLAARASQLADEARVVLGAFPHLDGIVFTDGAGVTDIASSNEHARPDPGVVGLRRRLDYTRTRETIVVAAGPSATQEFDAWIDVIESEPGFIEWVLPQFGLDPPPELRPHAQA